MKNATRFAIVLGFITIAAGLGVSALYQLTSDRIEAKREEAFAGALESIFPEADDFRVLGEQEAWTGTGVGEALSQGSTVGYLAVGARQGYSSTIRVLVGAEPDFSVRAINILEQAETPGLGERTREVRTDRTIWQAAGEAVGLVEPAEPEDEVPWFQQQFAGLTLDEIVVVTEESAEGVQSITGATVTAEAVADAVRDALLEIKAALSVDAAGGSGEG